jgi:hypothetical protein
MKKLLLVLTALLASVAFVPAAHAEDCDPDDGAAEFASCLAQRSLMRLRPAMPAPMPSSRLGPVCDADDDEDDCPRGVRMPIPGARPPLPDMPRHKAETPAPEKQPAAAEPKARAAAMSPGAAGGPPTAAASEAPVCTRYLPNLGKTIVIPCSEK